MRPERVTVQRGSTSIKQVLLDWCRHRVSGYKVTRSDLHCDRTTSLVGLRRVSGHFSPTPNSPEPTATAPPHHENQLTCRRSRLVSYMLLWFQLYDLQWPWPWFNPHPSGCIGPHSDAILICFELPPPLPPRWFPSLLTVLLQFVRGRPGTLLNPGTSQCNACRGMRWWSIRITIMSKPAESSAVGLSCSNYRERWMSLGFAAIIACAK